MRQNRIWTFGSFFFLLSTDSKQFYLTTTLYPNALENITQFTKQRDSLCSFVNWGKTPSRAISKGDLHKTVAFEFAYKRQMTLSHFTVFIIFLFHIFSFHISKSNIYPRYAADGCFHASNLFFSQTASKLHKNHLHERTLFMGITIFEVEKRSFFSKKSLKAQYF